MKLIFFFTLPLIAGNIFQQMYALVDTLQLPDPLMVILQRDSATSLDKITNVRKYTEHGTDFYEITFDNPVKAQQVVVYDELGKVKSPDLDKPKS